jgi:hypothetical protein
MENNMNNKQKEYLSNILIKALAFWGELEDWGDELATYLYPIGEPYLHKGIFYFPCSKGRDYMLTDEEWLTYEEIGKFNALECV